MRCHIDRALVHTFHIALEFTLLGAYNDSSYALGYSGKALSQRVIVQPSQVAPLGVKAITSVPLYTDLELGGAGWNGITSPADTVAIG